MPALQAARQAVGLTGGGGRGRVREVAGGEVTSGPRSKATACRSRRIWGTLERERDGCTIRCAALQCDAKRSVMLQQMTKVSSPTRCSLCAVVSCVCVEQSKKKKKGWDLVVVDVVAVK